MRACPSCSVISETEKGFCPECGTSYERSSATTVTNPATAKTKGSPVLMLAVIGLAAYVLSWLLLPILHLPSGFAHRSGYWSWGEALKGLSGFEGLAWLNDSVKWAVPSILGALSGYVLLGVVIVSSKKSS